VGGNIAADSSGDAVEEGESGQREPVWWLWGFSLY